MPCDKQTSGIYDYCHDITFKHALSHVMGYKTKLLLHYISMFCTVSAHRRQTPNRHGARGGFLKSCKTSFGF